MLRWNRAQKKRKEFAEMEMPTGKTIQTLRRQKGLTQEQLAEAVGVTAAAVSKWETASAYPDILLLCPLARALGTTPDTLLDFRPLLSEEELKAIWEKGRVLFESGRAEEACAYCEDILLSHPGDTALKFRIASLYMRYMAALKDEAFVQKQLERSIRLFEDSTHSTDTETREAAFYTLSGLYMMNGEAGRALDAVEKLPQPDYDARMLKASILRQMGQAEEAEKLHQTCLWGYVRDAGLCLYSLSAEARARGDTEKALALLDAACRLDVLFHGENAPGMHGNYELACAELLALAGKTPAALDAAEAYAESAVTGCRAQEYSPLFFDRLSSSGIMDVSDDFLRKNALFVLESSEPLHALKQEPRYAALLERLKAAAGTKPDDAGRKAN